MLNVFLHVHMCNTLTIKIIQYDQTALHHAAIHGRSEVVKYLLENTTAQVNVKDKVSQC